MIQASAIGIPVADFWRMTPHEFNAAADGFNWANGGGDELERELREEKFAAFYSELEAAGLT